MSIHCLVHLGGDTLVLVMLGIFEPPLSLLLRRHHLLDGLFGAHEGVRQRAQEEYAVPGIHRLHRIGVLARNETSKARLVECLGRYPAATRKTTRIARRYLSSGGDLLCSRWLDSLLRPSGVDSLRRRIGIDGMVDTSVLFRRLGESNSFFVLVVAFFCILSCFFLFCSPLNMCWYERLCLGA